MLPSPYRLKHRREFSAVYQRGFRRDSPHLVLRGLKPPASHSLPESFPLPPTQIGISVSQKVSKRAVKRNRIKRQLRAILKGLLGKIAPGWRLVIVVKPQAHLCEYRVFLQELEQLLVEAEVIHGHSRGSLL